MYYTPKALGKGVGGVFSLGLCQHSHCAKAGCWGPLLSPADLWENPNLVVLCCSANRDTQVMCLLKPLQTFTDEVNSASTKCNKYSRNYTVYKCIVELEGWCTTAGLQGRVPSSFPNPGAFWKSWLLGLEQLFVNTVCGHYYDVNADDNDLIWLNVGKKTTYFTNKVGTKISQCGKYNNNLV